MSGFTAICPPQIARLIATAKRPALIDICTKIGMAISDVLYHRSRDGFEAGHDWPTGRKP